MVNPISSENESDFTHNEWRFSQPYYMSILEKLIEEARKEIYEGNDPHGKEEKNLKN